MALTDNLVSYWKLDESSGNAADSVGSNTATNTDVTYNTGKINNGGVFNGSSSYFAPSNMGSFVSVSLWFNVNRTTGSNFIFGHNNFRIYTDTHINFGDSDSGYIDGGTISTGQWYHIVAISNGASSKIYVNNSAITNNTFETVSSNTTNFGRWVGDSNYFQGTIDEIGIWSRELSAAEVSSLYNSGNGIQYPFSSFTPIIIQF